MEIEVAMTHPFAVIEGIDGVGKTTVSKRLAERLGGVYLATPGFPFADIRPAIEQMEDPNARFFFYLTGLVAITPRIESLLKTQPVICDRWAPSTIAYHKALGSNMECIDLDLLPIARPSAAFLLTASDDIRHNRLAARGLTSRCDVRIEQDRALLARVAREYARLRLTVVDTSLRTPEQVVAELIRQIPNAMEAA